MKHLLKIVLGLVLCLGLFTACDDEEDNAAVSGFSLSKTEVAANAEGGKETVTVSSEGEWVAKSSEPWLSISPANGFGNTECVITIDEALKNEVREAEIRFIPKGQAPKVITVTQLGYGKMIHVKEAEVNLKASDVYEKRYFEAIITANVSFKIAYEWLTTTEEGVTLENWISLEKKNEPVFNLESARPQTYKVRFDWKMNPEWIERRAKINFEPMEQNGKSAEEVAITPILVTQAASPVITDDRAGDSLAILTIHERLASDIAINSSENIMETDRQGVAGSGSSRPRPFSKLRYHYYQRIPSARSKIPEIPGNFPSIRQCQHHAAEHRFGKSYLRTGIPEEPADWRLWSGVTA